MERVSELIQNKKAVIRTWPLINFDPTAIMLNLSQEIKLVQHDKVLTDSEKESFIRMLRENKTKIKNFEIRRYSNMGTHLDVQFIHYLK